MPTIRQSLLAKILRFYPLYSGAGTLANSKLVATLAGASNENVWCPTSGGDVLAPLHDYVGRAAYYCGDLDPKISWVCKNLVHPGDTVCDIGANIGIVTLLLSRLVGAAGKVFAFEPNPTSYEALTAAIARNRMINVLPLPFALGSQTEERNLLIPPNNAGAASLRETGLRTAGKTTRVSVRTLDEFVEERKIETIQFMKLDVEGFESEVFGGSSRVLGILRPDAILFEMNEKTTGPLNEHPVFSILESFDYAFLCLPKGLLKVRPRAIDPKNATVLPGHDVIAAPKGAQFERAAAKLNATSAQSKT
jgi:FkbM family methyltransferase